MVCRGDYNGLLANHFNNLLPYTYKFSRDVIFAVFAGHPQKLNPRFFKTIKMHVEHKG